MDAGVGVMMCAYSLRDDEPGCAVRGRWFRDNYSPCFCGGVVSGAPLRMLQPDYVSLPMPANSFVKELLDGVETFEGGRESYHQDCGLRTYGPGRESCIGLLHWSNKAVLLAANMPSGRRRGVVVTLNCRPGSTDASPHGWVSTTDGGTLMFRALQFSRRHRMNVSEELLAASF